MPLKAINAAEPILGYTLKERIGAGGYGEVWSAEAPGGLAKAIKFIFGYHDENRAQRELKALNRIKEVRHPFLLSLERIEVVDGQLVVITELADMSLKERFDLCLESGLKGIPRAELLGYLRDAADALDYISDEHSLQHLDIKPENLLLVSGHVKVADFGLVKDIHEGTQSMMGGLTPAFAPPELFDGRPNRNSDQYSLAIVFQEMLTGHRPFPGTTAAQLASQHMNSRPRFTALPRSDQPAITRALSKDPELRYPNCRTLVEELTNRQERVPARRLKSVGKQRPPRRSSDAPDATMLLPDGAQPLAMQSTKAEKLPPVDCQPKQSQVHPTLFLGIGHTGTCILQRLRRRLRERLGPGDDTPAIRILCVDTDRRDLAAATRGEGSETLRDRETLAMPLRKPDEYRADAKMHLSWLSRRWIYNVPRSLQTEGIRPLGRLAFADHHARFLYKLRETLSDICRPEALAKTAETVCLEPNEQPRVYLVTSISGGVGSGMVLDVAYAARTVMQELGYSDEEVVGILGYSTGGFANDRDLTRANTFACLSELYHYSCVSGYPGDESCLLPEFDDDRPTLGNTYLVHLGDNLVQDQFESITDSIAEYLYLNSVTRCVSFFDTCRAQEPDIDGLPLRTFGVAHTGGFNSDVVAASADMLCATVLSGWLQGTSLTATVDKNLTADSAIRAVGLSIERLMEKVCGVFPQTLGDDPIEHVVRLLCGVKQRNDGSRPLVADIRNAMEGMFGSASASTNGQNAFQSALETLAEELADDLDKSLGEALLSLIDDPESRIIGAEKTLHRCQHQLTELARRVDSLRNDTLQHIRELELAVDAAEPTADVESILRSYAELRIQELTLKGARRLIQTTEPVFSGIADKIGRIRGQLEQLAASYQPNHGVATIAEEDAGSLSQTILQGLADRVPQLADRVEQNLQHGFLEVAGGLLCVLRSDPNGCSLAEPLQAMARATIVDVLKETNVEEYFGSPNREKGRERLVKGLHERARPRLLDYGGAARLLVALPERSQSPEIAEAFGKEFEQQPNVIPATTGDLVACFEVQQVPLTNVTMSLLQDCPNCVEYASRLHTRMDVDWCPLASLS